MTKMAQVDAWLTFFLEGVIEIANSSVETCTKITALRDLDLPKCKNLEKICGINFGNNT